MNDEIPKWAKNFKDVEKALALTIEANRRMSDVIDILYSRLAMYENGDSLADIDNKIAGISHLANSL